MAYQIRVDPILAEVFGKWRIKSEWIVFWLRSSEKIRVDPILNEVNERSSLQNTPDSLLDSDWYEQINLSQSEVVSELDISCLIGASF